MEETVDRVHESFSRSPRKSIRQASRELRVPHSTVHNIVHKRLCLRAYKLQLLHHIKPDDHRKRTDFAVEILSLIEENDNYLNLMLFSDESTFHVCGKVNRHNCRIWGSENPHQVIEYERDTPKLSVWLGLHKHGVIGPFFFMESTVTGHSYLDMLENFAVPQIPPGFIFQQDGAPPQFHRDVTTFMDETFPGRWVVRGSPTAWPPRSPDLTPLDFFAWEFIKNIVYRRKVQDLADLRQCIIEAVELVTPHMLINTWQELEYCLECGICRATTGAHIEVYGRA